ncbi:exonuclease [Vibrio phage K250 g1]
MTTTNMIIWNQVSESDASTLKHGKVNGQEIKSINGTAVMKKATEVFGPIGKGWGYDITKDEFIQGVPVLDSKAAIITHEMMHTIQIKVWYKQGEEVITMPPQFGHTPYIMKTSYGPKTDFDAPKKSLTDAIKKSLSMLGFNADVFLGEWDDISEAQLQSVQTADKTEKREVKNAEQFETLIEQAEKAIKEELPAIKTNRLLDTFRNKWLRKCVNEQALLNKFNKACAERAKQIQEEAAAKRAEAKTDNNQEGEQQ